MEQHQQQIISNIPFASETMPKRQTALGTEIERSGGRLRGILPIVPMKKTDDPVYQELDRLDRAIGFPSKTIQETIFKDGKLQKVEVKLNQNEYRQYLKLVGESKRDRLERLFQAPLYTVLKDEGKLELIDRVLQSANEERSVMEFKLEQLRK